MNDFERHFDIPEMLAGAFEAATGVDTEALKARRERFYRTHPAFSQAARDQLVASAELDASKALVIPLHGSGVNNEYA